MFIEIPYLKYGMLNFSSLIDRYIDRVTKAEWGVIASPKSLFNKESNKKIVMSGSFSKNFSL